MKKSGFTIMYYFALKKRYILEITLDKQNTKIKKKYSEIKRFS
jgi:hypothetical protein